MNATTHRKRGFRLTGITASAVLVSLAFLVATGTAHADSDVESIQKLIETGDYDKAADVVDHMPNANDSFELQFLKGLAWQQIAETLPEGHEQRDAAIADAQSAYQRAAELRPQSSATLNNLGALSASAGRDQQARRFYWGAIELAQSTDDPKLSGYALNYARYLEDRDGKEAIRQAELAFKVPNPSAEARELLARLYKRYQPEQLPPFAVTLLKAGYADQVRDLSVAGARDVSLAEATRREWLNLLALALAQSAKSRVAFDSKPALDAVRSIPESSPVGAGARELVIAFNEPPGYDTQLAWWNSSAKGQATGTSSRVAMRTLLTALGDRTSGSTPPNQTLAARYYGTAIPMGDHGPDPEAFLSLVNVYADSGDTPALHALMSRYGDRLFSEKGDAYQRGDWTLIYRLHVALGMTYAHLGVWDSPIPYQNATFQLEAAQRASDRLNLAAQARAEPVRYMLPPAASGKLAERYTNIGRPDQAIKVRIDSAEALQKANRSSESTEVLRSIKASELPAASPETRAKYERLSTAAPVKVNLALNKPAQQSSLSEWSQPDDAQGAVDGVKSGRFGFHTGQEAAAWWQVDLQQVIPLREVRIFNRSDCCTERARTIRVLLSTDGIGYFTAYTHDGSEFTGSPLVIGLDGRNARFVRLQLAENTWLHLDEVEVYAE